MVNKNIGTNVGCNPTIRFDCNLTDLVLRSCKPPIYTFCVTERLISFLMFELVIQGFIVMTIYHVSECSNTPSYVVPHLFSHSTTAFC